MTLHDGANKLTDAAPGLNASMSGLGTSTFNLPFVSTSTFRLGLSEDEEVVRLDREKRKCMREAAPAVGERYVCGIGRLVLGKGIALEAGVVRDRRRRRVWVGARWKCSDCVLL